MANKTITLSDLSYGSASTGDALVSVTTGDTAFIRGIDDASKVGLVLQSSDASTVLTFSSTDVDYTGSGTGDLELTLATTKYHFVGPFDGTRLMVETSTGRYIQFTADGDVDALAFEM
jgi:hypothetical protein